MCACAGWSQSRPVQFDQRSSEYEVTSAHMRFTQGQPSPETFKVSNILREGFIVGLYVIMLGYGETKDDNVRIW